MKCGSHPEAGFTLVEILVVISIIALLAAILFPVFATSRRRAQNTMCLSNLAQIGKAVSMYAVDHDDRMPYAPSPDTKKRVMDGDPAIDTQTDKIIKKIPDFRTPLAAYGATQAMFTCPMDHMSRLLLDEGGHKPTWVEECGASYAYDDKYALNGGLFAGSPRPSNRPVAWDMEGFHGDTTMPGYCVVFADLHVKALTGQQFASERYDADTGAN